MSHEQTKVSRQGYCTIRFFSLLDINLIGFGDIYQLLSCAKQRAGGVLAPGCDVQAPAGEQLISNVKRFTSPALSSMPFARRFSLHLWRLGCQAIAATTITARPVIIATEAQRIAYTILIVHHWIERVCLQALKVYKIWLECMEWWPRSPQA
jgi:hypothetical protein